MELMRGSLTFFHTGGYFFRRVRLALLRSSGFGPRCGGCGFASEQASFAAHPVRRTDKSIREMAMLCRDCHSFVEQMRQDTRIVAFFIFSLGKKQNTMPRSRILPRKAGAQGNRYQPLQFAPDFIKLPVIRPELVILFSISPTARSR